MKKVKSNKKNCNKLILFLGIIFVVLLVICVGIFIKKNKENNEQPVEYIQEISDEQKKEIKQDEVAFYEIDTKICKLYFPEKWKNQIEVKYSDDAGYKAEFYGLVNGKEAQHLFDVCFNSDDGELLGYLENEDEVINISIAFFDSIFV